MEEQDGTRKRYEVKITRHAEQSMREIGTYIATDLMSPETAVKILGSFQTEIMKLSALPQRVHLTPEEPWHSLGIRRMQTYQNLDYGQQKRLLGYMEAIREMKK